MYAWPHCRPSKYHLTAAFTTYFLPARLLFETSLDVLLTTDRKVEKDCSSFLILSVNINKVDCLTTDTSFVIEQPMLALQSSAVAGERTVRSDYAMTWHDDANRISSIGKSYGAHGRRFP